jgi:molybdenum cofactor cytidylyltransferase
VVLAAGGSSRLGRPKQLLRRGGKPLLLEACEAANAVAPGRVVVVLGADGLRLRRLLKQRKFPGIAVHNSRWRDGMSSSLRRGLGALPPACAAALIVLCDQPQVRAKQLRALHLAWLRRPRQAAAAAYGGAIGVPAVLPRRLWPRAGTDDANEGARAMLRRSPQITCVAMPEAQLDIDTPADASAWAEDRQFPGRTKGKRDRAQSATAPG